MTLEDLTLQYMTLYYMTLYYRQYMTLQHIAFTQLYLGTVNWQAVGAAMPRGPETLKVLWHEIFLF